MRALILKLVTLVLLLGMTADVFAGSVAREPAMMKPSLGSGMQKPLEVKGQTRSMNMMLVNQGEREKLDFVKARTNYRSQILSTKY